MNNKQQTLSNFNEINKNLLSHPLSLIYMNIRSLRLNFNTFLVSIAKIINKIKIIILVETNISNNENNIYSIKGFYSIFVNREGKGGGVAIYIKENLNYSQISLETKSFESIQTDININNKNISLLSIYRPPDKKVSEFIKELEIIISKINNKQEIIIVGDINIDINKQNKTTATYLDMLTSNGMQPMINECTREDPNKNTRTCIDHLFAKCNNTNDNAKIITTTISDHYALFFCSNIKQTNQVRPNHNNEGPKLNNLLVNKKIKEVNWNSVIKPCDNANEIFNKIHAILSDIYKNSYKTTKLSKKRSPFPWINEEIIKYCDKRDELRKKYKNNKNIEKEYKTFRNFVNKKITYARNNHYRQKFIENRSDLRLTWQLINEIIGKKSNNIDDFIVKSFNNENISNIANNFAKNFSDNVNNIVHNCDILTLQTVQPTIQNSIYLDPTNESEIENILKNINVKKGAGIDLIRPKDLKTHFKIFTPILTTLINKSLESSTVPDLLKTSIIRPIYKNGLTTNYNNYRPIAILPAIEKVLEEVVVKRLTNFLSKYKIINKNQFGFQKGKSINKLLGHFSHHINESLSKNEHCLVLYIDFSKAFDTLSHAKLIEILEKYGIRGNTLNWFKNYLELRTYHVKINNILSYTTTSQYGVPQGSKLGPILYVLYANEMLRNLQNSTTFAYADDTAIIVSHKNINIATKTMQHQLNNATKWCHDNGLIINATKTKLMHIKARHLLDSPIKLIFHNTECLHQQTLNTNASNETCNTVIELVQSYKYLGVYVDSNFKWKTHIENVRTKLRKSSYMLYHLSNCAPYSVLRQAYFSLAESYLRHGITAWGSATYCNTLQKSQNQILKILKKSQHYHQNRSDSNNYIQNHNNVRTSNIRENNTTHLSSSPTNTITPINTTTENATQYNERTHPINILHNANEANQHTQWPINSTVENINNTQSRIQTTISVNNNLPKELKILNVKNIYSTTLATEFFNNSNFLHEIDHTYNTRRRAQKRYKVDSFFNDYGSSKLSVTLPKILNTIPLNIINETNTYKRKKLIKNFFISSQ